MFRLVCFVEDKNLHKVLHAMAGLVVNMEPPQPVINVTVKGGKLIQTENTATSTKNTAVTVIKNMTKGGGVGNISATALGKALKEAGIVQNSLRLAKKYLLAEGLIKRAGKRAYKIILK